MNARGPFTMLLRHSVWCSLPWYTYYRRLQYSRLMWWSVVSPSDSSGVQRQHLGHSARRPGAHQRAHGAGPGDQRAGRAGD